MPRLDLDPSDLAALAAQLRDTSDLLAGATALPVDTRSAASATGEPVLADALAALVEAWLPAHRTLVATLEILSRRLTQAAATFEAAETVTATGLSRAFTGTGEVPAVVSTGADAAC
ncbi:hypothetical protein GCM10009718_14540 [Isoptericola halotolerans]|uniref:Excreted virulence factor EspC (Type VII ESX diderm) n=1 Tax=Isoptericola halotolerans TaxID=300560 RepID=A0ABX1ZYE2_9MICO|nr:hypothetical protein [Isoptericola halotolerans]NOV95624.1 hypothetical protein [Isoptericola halotolerans]